MASATWSVINATKISASLSKTFDTSIAILNLSDISEAERSDKARLQDSSVIYFTFSKEILFKGVLKQHQKKKKNEKQNKRQTKREFQVSP